MLSLFLYPFCISLCTTFLVIILSKRYGLFMDDSNDAKPQNFHQETTPRSGGIGIFLGLGMLASQPFGMKLLLPLLLAFVSGIGEDLRRSLSPKLRLLLQSIAALSAVWLTHAVVTYLGLGLSMPYWLGFLFSIFAIVGMMNAINIIDGFNGLAAGVTLLILTSFGIVALRQCNLDLLNVITVTFGATLAFVIWNFPKGRIFLGDGGAYMLGFIMAVIGIFLAGEYTDVSPWYVLAVFIYPVWEVLFSIGRRITRGGSALHADATHLHTLVYKHITRDNPRTSLFIVTALTPFIAVSTWFANHSFANLAVIVCFITCYRLLYRHLYQKEMEANR